MKIQDSPLIKDVLEVFPAETGRLFLFNNIVVFEINEGVHLSYENTRDLFTKIFNYYSLSTPISFIANRINNYSIEVLDYRKLFNKLPNIITYGIVYYNIRNAYNIEIEKQFCPVPFIGYTNLINAFENTVRLMKNKKVKRTKLS